MEGINAILDYWKEFNLKDKKEQLDNTCIEIKELKSFSINGRKKLNDATKDFRNKPKENQLIDLTNLLKAYQDEIDQLSRRSKFCESAFLSLYKSIYEAPDPVPVIESYIQSMSSSSIYQLEIEKLKNELNQYEQEFQLLKNQDITIRKLEDQINDYKSKIDFLVQEEVNQRILEIDEQTKTKISYILDVQKAAEKRLAVAVSSMKQAQLSAEKAQNQLYEVSSQSENRLSALLMENNLLAEGSQRLTSRIIELENEVNHLKNTNNNINNNINNNNNNNDTNTTTSIISTGTAEVSSHDDSQTLKLVINELRSEIRKKEDFIYSEKTRYDHMYQEISQLLAKEKDQLLKTRQELLERPLKDDYISIKRQLKLLQKITFHTSDDDDDEEVCLPAHGQYVVFFYVILFYVIYVMLCYVILCYICSVMLCYVMLFYVIYVLL
jgi:homeobox protein cut-like